MIQVPEIDSSVPRRADVDGRRKVDTGKRRTYLMSFNSSNDGDIPPCTQKNLPSTNAAMGNAQKDSMHAS